MTQTLALFGNIDVGILFTTVYKIVSANTVIIDSPFIEIKMFT